MPRVKKEEITEEVVKQMTPEDELKSVLSGMTETQQNAYSFKFLIVPDKCPKMNEIKGYRRVSESLLYPYDVYGWWDTIDNYRDDKKKRTEVFGMTKAICEKFKDYDVKPAPWLVDAE